MNDIKFKSNSGQFNIDQAQGIVECFVAGIGNKDSVGDIVISGAFAKSLLRRKPRVVWGHNWNDPIGKVLEIYEVPPNDPRLPSKMKTAGIGGLYARVQFNLNSEKGREAFANVAFFGEEQEWSIGYKTLDAIYDNSRQANVLREVELYEVSPVLHGANQLTGTISVKSDEEKMHMMGGPAVAVVEKPRGPVDPFAQGVAQPADSDRTAALERELASRTGGPVKIMKANESSVVFMKPGKGVFRLGYYFDGEQYMFGKPEKMGATMMVVSPGTMPSTPGQRVPRIPNFPGVQAKPSATEPIVPVKYGSDAAASGFFDLDDEKSLSEQLQEQPNIVEQISGIIGSLQNLIGQHQLEKSEFIIPCAPENAFETKQALDPVFEYHRIETYVTEDGIVIASPLDGDAYEAVENATKSLFGRIGRGIGGGGKVRRGRAALSRIEGVLDPRKRRDFDGDGLIFDGTWMEQPDPNRFAQRQFNRLRSSGEGPKEITTALTGDEVPRLDISFTRREKTKISEMLDAVIGENQLPEDSPLVRLRDAIKSAKKIGEQLHPQLFQGDGESLLEAAKSEFEKLQPSFERHGGKKPGSKGRSASQIIGDLLKNKKYSRTNIDKRAQGGVGGVSARTGAAQGRRTNIVGSTRQLPKLGKKRKDGKVNVDEFIENEFLPFNWYEMSGNEKLEWLNQKPDGAGNEGTNEGALLGLRPRQSAWRKIVQQITDEALWQAVNEDDPEEAKREEREDQRLRRQRLAPQPSRQERQSRERMEAEQAAREKRIARMEAAKEPGDTPKSTTEPRKFKSDPDRPETIAHKRKAEKITAKLDKVKTFLGRQSEKGKVNKIVDDTIREGLDDIDVLIADEDDVPTLESMRDARDRIESLISTLTDPDLAARIAKTKKRNQETGKDEDEEEDVSTLTVQEQDLINGLKQISGDFSEHISEWEEREADLDAERDLIGEAGRSGSRADDSRYDTDEYGGGDDGIDSLRSSGATMRRSDFDSIMKQARSYQASYSRRAAGRSLRSSGDTKKPRTEIVKESTWWKKIDSSLKREIEKAPNDIVKNGLTVLQQKISKYKAGAFTPGSKRTNVGSIKITADEADKILDAVMSVIDRQMTAGKDGGVGSRGEIFAELLEAVSSAAMSTFIDKTGSLAD